MSAIDWKGLPFGYFKTDFNVRCNYVNGKWGELEVSDSEYITMHMAATCLHYGQEAFEGMKAFTGVDGKIRIFRLDENGKRLTVLLVGVMMPEIPAELFREAIIKAVKLNIKYVPPLWGGSFIIHPAVAHRCWPPGRSEAGKRIYVHRFCRSCWSLF
jgi:branched-chain amino acid aminotransferase